MPNVGGLEATRLIRNSEHEYKNIPIIGYTGDNSPKPWLWYKPLA